MRRPLVIALIALALIVVGGGTWSVVDSGSAQPPFPVGLHIVLFDVNQADALALVAPNGDAVVIDAGHGSTAAGKIADFLGDAGENGVGMGVVTHYDRDHVGGFEAFANLGLTFGTVIDQGPSQKRRGAAIYTRYVNWVGDPDDDGVHDPTESSFRRQRAVVGQTFMVGAAQIKVVSVRGDTQGAGHDIDLDPSSADIDENPGSIALLVTLGEFEFYTAGDQTSDDWKHEDDTEIAVVNAGALGGESDIDVFKANHHGSDTSNGAAFIQALDPEVAVISSVSQGNDRLPKRIVVKTLIDNGALVYITGDGLENGNFADSGAVTSDDLWTPPAGSFINSAGDVHILVSADGSRYRLIASMEPDTVRRLQIVFVERRVRWIC